MFQTPTMAAFLHPEDVPGIKHLLLGGEFPTAHVVAAWAGHVSLQLAYGPAETSCWTNCRTGIAPNHRLSDTGPRMHSCGFWIVDPDDHNRLVPTGATGELLINGSVVGLGYLGDEEKTSKAFIQAPAWATRYHVPGCNFRFYKSGDLAKFDSDGALNIVGRKDSQVKLRGKMTTDMRIDHTAPYNADVLF